MEPVKKTAKIARLVLITAGLFLMVWFLRTAVVSVLVPVAIALVIAFVLSPLVRKFEKKIPRALALAAAYGIFLLSIGLLLVFALPPLIRWIGELAQRIPTIIENAEAMLKNAQEQIAAFGIPNDLSSQLGPRLKNLAQGFGGAFGDIASIVSEAVSLAATLAIAFYLSFLFLNDRETLSGHVLYFMPQKYHKLARSTWAEIKHVLKRFAFAQGLIALLSFAGTVPWFYVIGISYPFTLGLFLGAFSLIPYIGPVIGAVPAAVVALMEGKLLFTVAAIFIVQQVLAVAGPKILGDTLKIHPVYIILLLLAFGSMFGFLGMLLAIPVSLLVKTAARNTYREIVRRKYAKTFE